MDISTSKCGCEMQAGASQAPVRRRRLQRRQVVLLSDSSGSDADYDFQIQEDAIEQAALMISRYSRHILCACQHCYQSHCMRGIHTHLTVNSMSSFGMCSKNLCVVSDKWAPVLGTAAA